MVITIMDRATARWARVKAGVADKRLAQGFSTGGAFQKRRFEQWFLALEHLEK